MYCLCPCPCCTKSASTTSSRSCISFIVNVVCVSYKKTLLVDTAYVGLATVAGFIWWFVYSDSGPKLPYIELVSLYKSILGFLRMCIIVVYFVILQACSLYLTFYSKPWWIIGDNFLFEPVVHILESLFFYINPRVFCCFRWILIVVQLEKLPIHAVYLMTDTLQPCQWQFLWWLRCLMHWITSVKISPFGEFSLVFGNLFLVWISWLSYKSSYLNATLSS